MNTLPLFDALPVTPPVKPPPSRMARRREAMDAAFEAADARFREEYERLVLWFAARGVEFTGEDVQNEYKRRTQLPQPREWRATGAIYLKLKRRGAIKQTGFRSRNQGNPTPVYRGSEQGRVTSEK